MARFDAAPFSSPHQQDITFTWESRPSTGSGQVAIELVFRPRFYQKHRGLAKFDLKGAPQQEVKFADLGLEADREYLVFAFRDQKFLGKFKGSFTAPTSDR